MKYLGEGCTRFRKIIGEDRKGVREKRKRGVVAEGWSRGTGVCVNFRKTGDLIRVPNLQQFALNILFF